MSGDPRIMNAQTLVAWRRQVAGEAPVAVVTGTFDMFQPGNLQAVREARRIAGHVIVVVEPDADAAGHCRPGRPQNAVETRVEMVSHLRDVDAVTSVSPGDAQGLFEGLKPLVWVTAQAEAERSPYAGALCRADRMEVLLTREGCATEEILAAIDGGRTPIHLPAETPDGASSRAEAKRRRAAALHTARPVVVTVNGCFDILHVGHLRFLAEARAMGDSLTVLMNNDASVARYKGPTRPVFPEAFRASALEALRSVDDVVAFPGDNPLPEIERVKPALHVKGGSYEPDRVRQERELVERWGGKLVCTALVEGFSTTNFIRKALASVNGS